MTDTKEAFEEWAEAHYVSPAFFKISGSDDYANEIIQNAWDAWQASRQALEGGAIAHVFPDDIKKLESSECTVNAYSVEMGDPDRGETVPLYTHPASADEPLHLDCDTCGKEMDYMPWHYATWSVRHVHACNECWPKVNPASAHAQKEIERWKMVAHDQAATISELQGLVHANHHEQVSVPKGWTIEPFDDGFGVEGISVLWPDNRGGAHLRANDPKNSIAQNLLYDLADALLFDSPASDRPSLGQRKAAQIGPVIGVLVQNQDGKVCSVTDLGRCTWLNQDVTGPGDGKTVRLSVHEYTAGSALEALKFYTECMQRRACGDPEPIEHHYAMQAIDELEALFPKQEPSQ